MSLGVEQHYAKIKSVVEEYLTSPEAPPFDSMLALMLGSWIMAGWFHVF